MDTGEKKQTLYTISNIAPVRWIKVVNKEVTAVSYTSSLT